MKVLTLLPLALAVSGFVVPDAETLNSLKLEDHECGQHPFWDNIKNPAKVWDELEDQFAKAARRTKHKFFDAVDHAHDIAVDYSEDFRSAFAGQAWLDSANDFVPHFPHDGPPHDGPPHHGPPGKGPHHPPPHGPHHPDKTVYELIAESKYTTKLAKAINEFPDLVELLNGTKANYTVFAPIDSAFDKIPEHAPKPSKEFLKKLLTYHVSPEAYTAGDILVTRTLPSALKAEDIGGNPQRLSTQIGLRGLTVNFYARIIAINIFGTNGVIHGVDSIIIPPPKVIDILNILPGEFSTLDLALAKTGLDELFNRTDLHEGGTFFAPSNLAFYLLGPRINAFLFSKYGEKYLKALILYHAAPDVTLYSDAIYKAEEESFPGDRIPRGRFHIDLPSGLEDKSLSVDVARFGRLITIRVNGFTDASVLDGVAADGVIHVVSRVLIPPKEPGMPAGIATEDMSLEEFKQRLEPYVAGDDMTYNWDL